jgi:monoamine oxidase
VNATERCNVAVVGGGIAGAYAAWRLQTDTRFGATSICLFEASGRVGGRLESLTPPGAPQLRAEFGGMAFTTAHTLVHSLVKTVFELEVTDFATLVPDLLYLRGRHLTETDVANGTVPYALRETERGKSVGELLVAVVANLIGADPAMLDHAGWRSQLAGVTIDGLPAQDAGFWNFLTQPGGLSFEGYAFARDAMGHHFPFTNSNAADALEWFFADFAPDVQFLTLPDGYERLPESLASSFEASGGTLALNTPVTRVERAPSGDGFALQLGNGGRVHAATVILALPRRAIELITPGSVILGDPDVRQLVQTVRPLPIMKLFLAYSAPWWMTGGVAPARGRSVTDLPLRTIHYFGVEEEPTDPANTNALLMASYTDAVELDYWHGLRRGRAYPDRPSRFTEEHPGSPEWHEQAATSAMVSEATRQLASVHPMLTVPAPYTTAFKDWGDDPYGGAVHVWNVGVTSDDVAERMLQPRAGAPLYVCGEAYSRKQGWAEGALDAAEAVVQRIGVAPPHWLRACARR